MSDTASKFSIFTSTRYDEILLDSKVNESLSFTYPSPFYMLVYHRDRMLEAAHHFQWPKVVERLLDGSTLEKDVTEEVNTYLKDNASGKGPLKVRILFNELAEIQFEISSVPLVSLSILYPNPFPPPSNVSPKPFKPSPLTGGALTLGSADSLAKPYPSEPQWHLYLDSQPTPPSSFTSLKTTHRAHYTSSRARALPDEAGLAEQNPQGGTYHEVLMFNAVGEMTEGSTTSLYFFRGGRWVTPPVGNTSKEAEEPSASDQMQEDEKTRAAIGEVEDADRQNESDGLPQFEGRWGHSLRSSTTWPDSGGQRGTTRRWALKVGLCSEEIIERSTVRVGEEVWVSNGVRGFGKGKVIG